MYTLKPCPFCGKKELLFEKGFVYSDTLIEEAMSASITCMHCNIQMLELNTQEDSLKNLVEVWNKRG